MVQLLCSQQHNSLLTLCSLLCNEKPSTDNAGCHENCWGRRGDLLNEGVISHANWHHRKAAVHGGSSLTATGKNKCSSSHHGEKCSAHGCRVGDDGVSDDGSGGEGSVLVSHADGEGGADGVHAESGGTSTTSAVRAPVITFTGLFLAASSGPNESVTAICGANVKTAAFTAQ